MVDSVNLSVSPCSLIYQHYGTMMTTYEQQCAVLDMADRIFDLVMFYTNGDVVRARRAHNLHLQRKGIVCLNLGITSYPAYVLPA